MVSIRSLARVTLGLAAFGIAVGPAPVRAAILVVPHQYALIKDAVAAASEGDTILIGPQNDSIKVEGISVRTKSLTFMSAYGPRCTRIERPFSILPTWDAPGWYVPDTCRMIGLWFLEGGSQFHVYFGGGASFRVEGCVFQRLNTNSGPNAAVFASSSSGRIVRNNFLDLMHAIGAQLGGGSPPYDSILINSNLVLRSTRSAVQSYGAGMFASYNDFWQNALLYDTFTTPMTLLEGNIEVDPLLIEPTMMLDAGSPATNAGDPGLALDADGTRADMGIPAVYDPWFPHPAGLTYGPDAVGEVVTSFTPVFGWTFADSGSLAQAAFEVEVGTDTDWSSAELWQSGMLIGSDDEIAYAGASLSDRTWYYVRVRLQNGHAWGPWRQERFAIRTSGPISVPGDATTIQEAVDMSLDGDTLLVGPGVYSEEIRIHHKGLCLLGSGSETTLLDGQGLPEPQIQVVGGGGDPTVIRGFTVYNSDAEGGAIVIADSARVELEDCCICYNGAQIGSVVHNYGYGAVNVTGSSVAWLRRNRIHHNSSLRGGAITATRSHLILEGNLIHDNVSQTTGGAVFTQYGRTDWRHNTVVYNFADLTNAFPDGAIGGIHAQVRVAPDIDSTVALDNIVAWNSLFGLSLDYTTWPPQYQIDNNVFYGHLMVDGGTYPYESEPEKWAGNLEVDPLLGPDYLPLTGSPVIGTATDGGNIGLDFEPAACSPLAVGPECGNGTLEPGEACDDGNQAPGDGCDAVCRPEIPPCLLQLPGDINQSESVSSSDVILLVNYVFKSGSVPQPCEAAGDMTCSGQVTSADIIHLVNFVFKGGASPCDYCDDGPMDCL